MQFGRTWQAILDKKKTQTRRLVKPGDRAGWVMNGSVIFSVYAGGNRPKWKVGSTYALQPGRGKRTVFWKEVDGRRITTWDDDQRETYKYWTKKALRAAGWNEARIRITAIRRERLRDISCFDASAEGCEMFAEDGWVYTPIGAFKRLWDGIHTTPDTRWEDNPEVWALTFELVGADGNGS